MVEEQGLKAKKNINFDPNISIDLMYLIDDMWKGLKRFFWIIPVVVLLFAGTAFTLEKARYHSVYEAFTSFAINTRTAYGYTSTYYNKTVATQLSKTFPYILTSGILSDIVKEDLGVETLNGEIYASAIEDSSVFTIKVISYNRQDAYDILQSVIRNYPKVSDYIIGETQMDIIDESGIPTRPVNRARYKRAIVLGGFLGGLVCIAFLFLYAYTRNTVRGDEDLKENLSITYLGAVPHIKTKARSKKVEETIRMDNKEAPSVLGECMRTIRTRFIREADTTNAQTILITSASEGEGKTTVAINLAISLSRQDIRVILIDADLRNPCVAKEMGIKLYNDKCLGIMDVLQDKVLPEKALVPYGKYGIKVLPGTQSLETTGPLLGSKEFDRLLSTYSEMCDVILVDSPPCGVVSDASIIARKTDGVVFVVRQDYARLDQVLESIENTADIGVDILGYILNDTERGITGYGYNYGYGYGYGYNYGYGYGYGYGGYGEYGAKKNNEDGKILIKTESKN